MSKIRYLHNLELNVIKDGATSVLRTVHGQLSQVQHLTEIEDPNYVDVLLHDGGVIKGLAKQAFEMHGDVQIIPTVTKLLVIPTGITGFVTKANEAVTTTEKVIMEEEPENFPKDAK